MKAWFEHNLHSLGLAAARLRDAPLASLFSILVIGVALSLPAGLYVLLGNVDRLAGGVQTRPEVTLFLKAGVTQDAGRRLARELAGRENVGQTRFISRDEGLRRLQDSGLADIAAGLADNPLPDSITLTARQISPAALEALAADLRKLPEVEHLSLDADWARRLAALIDFAGDLVWSLAALLGLSLAAITGNTIRLQIFALRDEIEVSRLIGATDRFIRRPFLYFGALQGLLGGVTGWAMVSGSLLAVESSLDGLASAWGTRLQLHGLNGGETAVMLALATGLGLLGALLAVNYTLHSLFRDKYKA
jgi:cell division transport system permease protein